MYVVVNVQHQGWPVAVMENTHRVFSYYFIRKEILQRQLQQMLVLSVSLSTRDFADQSNEF